MDKITITASKTYQVITDAGLLAWAGRLIRDALGEKTKKLCVVTDRTLDDL